MAAKWVRTAPELLWHAAGEPPHKYAEESGETGPCATCATPLDGRAGVPTRSVNNPTFSNHAEFFKFGSYVCRACAWLYGDPKRTHRNVLAVGDKLWWPMISVESATEERPSWLDLLYRVAGMPPETSVAGVLTSDPKPRLWPRMRLSTVGAYGLYVHSPDYSVSEWRALDLTALLSTTGPVLSALALGFPKARIYSGLPGDYRRTKGNVEEAMRLESELRVLRNTPEFVPALLVSGVKKEELRVRETGRADEGPERRGEARGQAHQDHDRLF